MHRDTDNATVVGVNSALRRVNWDVSIDMRFPVLSISIINAILVDCFLKPETFSQKAISLQVIILTFA